MKTSCTQKSQKNGPQSKKILLINISKMLLAPATPEIYTFIKFCSPLMYLLGSCGFCNVLKFLFTFYYIPSPSRNLCRNWHNCSNVFGNSGSIWDTLCLVPGSYSSR